MSVKLCHITNVSGVSRGFSFKGGLSKRKMNFSMVFKFSEMTTVSV